jgi:hypothetical protein
MNVSLPQPSYPNYSLPQANLSLPEPPPNSQTPNISLIFSPTSAALSLTQIPQTGCRLNAVAPPAGTNSTPRLWLRDEQGWRMQFFVEGLTPSTNYTVYVVQSGTRVSGPMYFITKSCMSFSDIKSASFDSFQHLSRVSYSTLCLTAHPRRTLSRFHHPPRAQHFTMIRRSQATSQRRSSLTSPTLQQLWALSPVGGMYIHPCRLVQIVSAHTANGFVVSCFHVALSFHHLLQHLRHKCPSSLLSRTCLPATTRATPSSRL